MAGAALTRVRSGRSLDEKKGRRMFQWLDDHSAALSVLANIGLLLVWFTYLHLFLVAHVRQRRPNILINRGAGTTLDAHCLISNMSAEPIYVQTIIASMKNDSENWTAAVTDMEELTGDQIGHASEATSQGPLGVGEFMDVGTFARLAQRAGRQAGVDTKNLCRDYDVFKVTVVAAYGSDKLSVAACREFSLEEGRRLNPKTVSTIQVRSRRRRKEIDRYLAEYL